MAGAHRAVFSSASGTALRMDAVQYPSIPIPNIYADLRSGRLLLHAVHRLCRGHLLRNHQLRGFSLLLVPDIPSFDGRYGSAIRPTQI